MPENPSAFPRPAVVAYEGINWTEDSHSGMTLRDWFAGQALIGVTRTRMPAGTEQIEDILAAVAYKIADAMLKERERDASKQS